jgi:hypothetical protein
MDSFPLDLVCRCWDSTFAVAFAKFSSYSHFDSYRMLEVHDSSLLRVPGFTSGKDQDNLDVQILEDLCVMRKVS